MTREAIINKTLKVLSALPAEKAEEVADFASYILKKHEDDLIQRGVQKLTEASPVYKLLEDEEELYTLNDIKEKY
jgi:hypothetical protein